MASDRDIDQAVDGLYDAIFTPATRSAAPDRFSRSLNADGCFFYPQRTADTILSLPVVPGVADFIDTFIKDGWYLRDTRAARGWPLLAAGRPVLHDPDIWSTEEGRRSTEFNELYSPWGLTDWSALSFSVEGRRWCLPLLYRDGQPLDDGRLAAVGLHLGRIVRLAEKLVTSRADDNLNLLERFGCAAVALDAGGGCVGANARAEALFNRDLQIVDRRLIAREPGNDASLQRLIGAAISPSTSVLAAISPPVILQRDLRRPLLIDAAPLQSVARDLHIGVRALLWIVDLDASSPRLERVLADAYRLTPAETRLALRMAEGVAVDDAAGTLGIARETARNQLKSVYAKMGVSRQAELATIIARLPPASTTRKHQPG